MKDYKTFNINEIEKIIDYKFKNPQLLENVFTHPSFLKNIHFDRLEFLGDRVLSQVVASFLYKQFPDDEAGKMALRFISATNTNTLSSMGKTIGLPDHIKCTGKPSDSVIADTLEALIGAIFIDGGYTKSKKFVFNILIKNIIFKGEKNEKNLLQEWAQKNKYPMPEYICMKEAKVFSVIARIKGIKQYGVAQAKNKKEASILAAKKFLDSIDK